MSPSAMGDHVRRRTRLDGQVGRSTPVVDGRLQKAGRVGDLIPDASGLFHSSHRLCISVAWTSLGVDICVLAMKVGCVL